MRTPAHPIAAGKSSFDLVDPQKVFAELKLQPDSILLDAACGIGNYSLAAAGFIGEQGAIHAVDLWEEGIQILRERAREMGIAWLRAEVADIGRELPLADGSADVALMATVLHDLVVEGIARGALGEIARVLRSGGRLAVIEFDKKPSEPGPPVAIRLSPSEVEELVTPFGFRKERVIPVGPSTYLISFALMKRPA